MIKTAVWLLIVLFYSSSVFLPFLSKIGEIVNIGPSSSVQATNAPPSPLNMEQRVAKNTIGTFIGQAKIQHREAPDNTTAFTELENNLNTGLLPLLKTPPVVSKPAPEPEIEPQEISLDGKWHAWRNAEKEIICKPADSEGPVKQFSGEGCEEFTFCAQSQYLMLPHVEMLSSHAVKALRAEQAEVLAWKNAFINSLERAAEISGLATIATAAGEVAVLKGMLLKGVIWKIGTVLIAPIWVTTSATALIALGAVGARGILAKNKFEQSDLLKNSLLQPAPSPQVHEPRLQAQEEIEMLASAEEAEDAAYQRITLRFEPTRAEIKPQPAKVMHIKGTVSSSAFSADKKHFFTVIDGKTIKQWSTKTGKLEKSIEPCESTDSKASSIANKPTSITELTVSPQGKWLLLAEMNAKGSAQTATIWLYSHKHARVQSHFALTPAQNVQFKFSPCERWLAVLEGNTTILLLSTESGAFQKKPVDPLLGIIQNISWDHNTLQIVGEKKHIWKITPIRGILDCKLIAPILREPEQFKIFRNLS